MNEIGDVAYKTSEKDLLKLAYKERKKARQNQIPIGRTTANNKRSQAAKWPERLFTL